MGKFRALNDAKRAERAARQDDSQAGKLVVCVGFHGSGMMLGPWCPPLSPRLLMALDHMNMQFAGKSELAAKLQGQGYALVRNEEDGPPAAATVHEAVRALESGAAVVVDGCGSSPASSVAQQAGAESARAIRAHQDNNRMSTQN